MIGGRGNQGNSAENIRILENLELSGRHKNKI